MTNQLSPAAQAVLTTYEKVWGQGYGSPLAAALRAAADQVVPENSDINMLHRVHQSVRYHLLAIAAELEGADG